MRVRCEGCGREADIVAAPLPAGAAYLPDWWCEACELARELQCFDCGGAADLEEYLFDEAGVMAWDMLCPACAAARDLSPPEPVDELSPEECARFFPELCGEGAGWRQLTTEPEPGESPMHTWLREHVLRGSEGLSIWSRPHREA